MSYRPTHCLQSPSTTCIISLPCTLNNGTLLKICRRLTIVVVSQHFAGTTGYGHNDAGGREALDVAFASIAGAEAAIVRSQVYNSHIFSQEL